MRGDARSRRVAIVPDGLLNPPAGAPDLLATLAADGFGVVALCPQGLDADAGTAWRAAIVQQVAVYLADGYEVVLVRDDSGETAAFEHALHAAGHCVTRLLDPTAS